MEFLKAKLLPKRKSENSISAPQPPPTAAEEAAAAVTCNTTRQAKSSISSSNGSSSHSREASPTKKTSVSCIQLINPMSCNTTSSEDKTTKPSYDWRQDTPFWNAGAARRGASPSKRPPPSGKKAEEVVVGPWQNLHVPVMGGVIRDHHPPARSSSAEWHSHHHHHHPHLPLPPYLFGAARVPKPLGQRGPGGPFLPYGPPQHPPHPHPYFATAAPPFPPNFPPHSFTSLTNVIAPPGGGVGAGGGHRLLQTLLRCHERLERTVLPSQQSD